MPTTDQDARALTYLARRLRNDTHGCGTWDEAGTYAAVSKLVGTNLFDAIERVTRHAVDREARTPGAIGRPFLPDAPAKTTPRNTGPWCGICGVGKALHRDGDHDFEQPNSSKLPADQAREIVTELRNHLHPQEQQ